MNDPERDDSQPAAENAPASQDKPAASAARRPASPVRKQSARRRFIRSVALAGGVLGLAMFGYAPVGQARMHCTASQEKSQACVRESM